MYRFAYLTTALATMLLVPACSRNQPDPLPAPVADGAGERARRDSIEAAEAARRATEQRERDERDRVAREASERAAARIDLARRTLVATVHFEYDRDDLTPDTRSALDSKAEVLQQSSALRIRIEGHTDERGSDEYNVALGQRRAAAAKRYLTSRGIGEDRIETVSKGEAYGVCNEESESCWSRNRRAEFLITSGSVVAGQ
jgi:peptidoglycan-associated lipoprotein